MVVAFVFGRIDLILAADFRTLVKVTIVPILPTSWH